MLKNMANEGALDRVIRVVLGIVLGVFAYAYQANITLVIILSILAAIMLVTAAIGFCPLYSLFGMRTCPLPGKK